MGAVGKVKFVSNRNHTYSGLLRGADHALIRLSSAAQPSPTQPLVPGMALKFLIDGRESANILAMNNIDGQPENWNFFAHNLTNHVNESTSKIRKLLSAKYADVTDYIHQIGLRDIGAFLQDGRHFKRNHYPYQIKFMPHDDVNYLFSKNLEEDYNEMVYVDQLADDIDPDSTLYRVFALNKPE